MNTQQMNNEQNILDKFGQNITKLAKNQKLSPIIGRDIETKNVIRILTRKTKNNPILIGEPGVGKTAIVEGLALKIVAGDVPSNLVNKEIYSLDLGSLIAGAKFQGEFEERLKNVINEVVQRENVILFIDEIHMIIGMGQSTSAMDGANLLKPMLARGELSIIGATTFKEYKQTIEKDGAFERRFQKVKVEEPTEKEALNILRGIKSNLEIFHGVKILDEALNQAVIMSNRYINDRYLPDKAIDIIDEAAANINVQLSSSPESLENIRREILEKEIERKVFKDEKNTKKLTEVKDELKILKEAEKELNEKWLIQKEKLTKERNLTLKLQESLKQLAKAKTELDYEKAAKLEYSFIPELKKEIAEIQNNQEDKLVNDLIDTTEIYTIISRLTGIPVNKLSQNSKDKLLHLENNLNTVVIGQEDATKEIANSIIRNRADISDPNRPIGSFLFLGPTGVGKTEITKALAYELMDNQKKMFRIDMSEYMEKHAVARLIGSPPGYVGYEEGGTLTEYVKNNPYSIILFDEIEKAHPDVLNILLQILDEGHLTDNKGSNINFKNTIIIMTSNIGSDKILNDVNLSIEELTEDLNYNLRPEFLNRIDSIVKFNPINPQVYKKIITKFLKELNNRLVKQDKEFIYSDEIIDYIYQKSFTPEYGARPIKRFIQKNIENKIALKLIDDQSKTIELILNNDEINVK